MVLSKRNSGQQVAKQLKQLYGRWAGELHWIENPPKLRQRPWRGGEAFAAEAGEREARAEAIREALPHITYVVQLLDPAWRPESEKLIRPRRESTNRPPHGWIEATYEALREAGEPLTVRELVGVIAERYDLDVSVGPEYAQAYGAINVSLLRGSEGLENDGGKPPKWALKSRNLLADLTDGGEDGQ